MKRKQVLAILLSVTMTAGNTMPVVLHAEEVPATETQTQQEETAVPETAAPQETAAPETAPQTEAAPVETAAATEAPAPVTEAVQETAPEAVQEDASVETTAETASANDGEKESAQKGSGSQDFTEENDFLKVKSAKAYEIDGKVVVEVKAENMDYDALYFGDQKDQKKDPVIKAEDNTDKINVFRFEITKELLGKKVPFVPKKKDGTWYTGTVLFLQMPSELSELTAEKKAEIVKAENNLFLDLQEETVAETETSASETATETAPAAVETEAQAETAAEPETVQVTETAVVPETVVNEEAVEAALFLAEETMLKDQAAIDNSTTLADGTYTPESFSFTGGTGKLKITCSQIKVSGGKATAVLGISSTSIAEVQWAGGSIEGTGIQTVEVPVKLNADTTITLLTVRMDTPHYVNYTVNPVIAEPDADETDKQTETDKQEETQADTPAETDPQTESEQPKQLTNGTYSLSNVELVEGRMFNIIDCKLTVKDGNMTAVLTLHGTGYDYVYMGTAEDANKADSSSWIPYVANADGQYTYTVPVSALDTKISVAARSARYAAEGAEQPWYDRGIVFHSASATKISDDVTNETEAATNAGNTSGSNNGQNTSGTNTSTNSGKNNTGNNNSNTGNNNSSKNGTSGTASSTGKTGSGTSGSGSSTTSSSSLNGSTGAVNSATTLADGDYTPDSFTWSGGTGKLNITCDKLSVKSGKATATIVFSSGYISYVKANGTKFSPVSQTSTQSVYEIPVELNANNKIIACTTKMSVPHEIEYTLYFGLEAAKAGAVGDASGVKKTGGGSSTGSGSSTGTTVAGQPAADGSMTEKVSDAPEIPGLTYESTMKNEAAEYFRLHYYDDGFKVLEISLADGDETDWTKTSASVNEQKETEAASEADDASDEEGKAETKAASLYTGEVLQYLIVPEDAEIPAGVEKTMIIVQEPVDAVYAGSGMALKMMEKLELTDSLMAVAEEYADDKELADIEDLKTAEWDDKDLFKTVVLDKIKLAIVPSEVLEETDEDAEETASQKLGDSLNLLNAAMIVDRISDEKEDLGKYEWLKVYGAMFDKQEEAGNAYNSAKEALGVQTESEGDK